MNERARRAHRAAPRPAGGREDATRHRGPAGAPLDERLRPWLLGGAVSLYVARTMMPTDTVAAETGSGLPFVMLWLLLGLIWTLGTVFSRRMQLRTGWADAAVLALVLWIGVSSLLALRTEAPRPTWNMLWEWIGLGLGYFALRQLLRSEREARAILAVMLALAVGHSLHAYYQQFVSFPATQAEYRRDPDAAIRAAGIQAPPGSPERKQFEDRLLHGNQPFSTFTLTNSLAGYLAPWLMVGLGILATGWRDLSRRPRPLALVCLSLTAIAACLYLTNSRSGCLATILGTVLLMLALAGGRLSVKGRNRLAMVTGLVAVGVGIAVAGGGLESAAVMQARRSLGYRLEYWQASAGMIADHPLFGVGAGNFGDWYTLYKLPQAMEEVKDPHNFLVEVCACSGTPAVLALIAFVILVLLTVFHSTSGLASKETAAAVVSEWRERLANRLFGTEAKPDSKRHESGQDAGRPIQIGGLLGLLLAPAVALVGVEGPEFEALACVGLGFIAGLWGLSSWVNSGRCTTLVPALGLLVLLVNLLAAGGIGFPAVAGTLWILGAVAVTLAEGFGPLSTASKGASASVAGGLLILALACQATGVGPVLNANRELARFEEAAAAGQPREAYGAAESAALADPWSSLPRRYLAQFAYHDWLNSGPTASLAEFEQLADRQLELAPHSNMAWFEVGLQCLEAQRRSQRPEHAQLAVKYLRRTVDLYPASAVRRGQLALALRAAGNNEAAEGEAAAALRLDEQTPHPEKKLPAELRAELERRL